MTNNTVLIKIKRQNGLDSKSYWEEFEVPYRHGMNVISALMDIALNPTTRQGKATTPITYESNCLEEVCGSCAMRINGRVRMACSALIDNLDKPIRLEPLNLPQQIEPRWVSGDVHVHMNYGGAYRNTPQNLIAQAAAAIIVVAEI